MSKFSGKFDLYDEIYMHSDDQSEKELFEKFKEQTDGKIYQMISPVLTNNNISNFLKTDPELTRTYEVVEFDDKRCKSGKNTKRVYTYHYHGKDYSSLQELNEKALYLLKIEIPFNDRVDLIKYYPYIPSMISSSNNKTMVVISDESYSESMYRDLLESGYKSKMYEYEQKALKEEYIRVIHEDYPNGLE